MTAEPLTRTPPKPTGRAWLGLFVLALPALLLSIDVSVLYLALPTMTRELGAGATEQLWILDIYGFLLAGFLITMGSLGDRIGRRKLMLAGAAAFGAASTMAAFSVSPEMLIAARALMGVAGATLMPTTLATIRTIFAGTDAMPVAISVWFGCFMLGMLAGPIIGGSLISAFGWGSVFLLGVPVMALLLVAGPWLLPESRDDGHGMIDLPSVGLSLLAILPLAWGVKEFARIGWTPGPGLAVLVGLLSGYVFLRRQRHLSQPLVDLHLFRNPAFSGALAMTGLGGVVMAGTSLVVAIHLQSVARLPPWDAGLWLIPQNIAMVLGFVAAPILARRLRPSAVMAAGLVVGAAGFVLLAQVQVGLFAPLVAGMALASFGVAAPMSLGASALMAAAPEERAGSAASISETSGEFGVAVGVAVLGSVAALAYRTHLSASIGGGPKSALDGLDHALVVAAALPEAAGKALALAAREAFTHAVHLVGWIAAVVFLGLAVLAHFTLREQSAGQDR
ncbi:MFS transporter [Nonomuraea sp. MCN248]|uniref:MFS transporter n=1 Tax=Nonomuraea corallina TaxID=2989783 RepID=A0ABT4SJF1_9ACTN|nr:MFS transporter [Nonomuraea corallina]MDA0637341.1 MFS transporter [Nonomuraea corallina]